MDSIFAYIDNQLSKYVMSRFITYLNGSLMINGKMKLDENSYQYYEFQRLLGKSNKQPMYLIYTSLFGMERGSIGPFPQSYKHLAFHVMWTLRIYEELHFDFIYQNHKEFKLYIEALYWYNNARYIEIFNDNMIELRTKINDLDLSTDFHKELYENYNKIYENYLNGDYKLKYKDETEKFKWYNKKYSGHYRPSFYYYVYENDKIYKIYVCRFGVKKEKGKYVRYYQFNNL